METVRAAVLQLVADAMKFNARPCHDVCEPALQIAARHAIQRATLKSSRLPRNRHPILQSAAPAECNARPCLPRDLNKRLERPATVTQSELATSSRYCACHENQLWTFCDAATLVQNLYGTVDLK